MEQWHVWLALIVILTFIECTTINLTTIWFIASGIISLIISLFTDNYLIQFGVFVVVGIILLITTRPMLVKALKAKREVTNLDRVIGMQAVVTEEIEDHGLGEVKVDGKKWTAYADTPISVGKIVRVLEINGVKLKVKEEGEK